MAETEPEQLSEEANAEIPSSPIALDLVPQRLTFNSRKVIINWRLKLTNESDGHIVALRIWSDLTTAKRAAITSAEAGRPEISRSALREAPMLAPGAQEEWSGEWQMTRDEAMPLKIGPVRNFKEPRILPVARFRLIGAGIDPTYVCFAIGTPAGDEGALPAPVLIDGKMQIYADLAATRLS